MFCYPNWVDAGTLSGGSWNASYPLTALQDRRRKVVARSTDATLSATQVVLDIGAEQRIDCVALIGGNLSLDAQVRVSIDDAGLTEVYNSGWVAVYPASVYPSGQELWGETVTSVDADAYAANKRWPFILLPDVTSVTLATGRYVTVEIDDQSNSDGYVEIGRLWVSSSYQPSGSLLQGASYNIQDDSTRTTTDGGTYYFVQRDVRRSWVFELGYMDQYENKIQVLEMKRRLGTTGQILFVPNRDDDIGIREQSILGVFDEPSPATVLSAGLYRQPLRLSEEL